MPYQRPLCPVVTVEPSGRFQPAGCSVASVFTVTAPMNAPSSIVVTVDGMNISLTEFLNAFAFIVVTVKLSPLNVTVDGKENLSSIGMIDEVCELPYTYAVWSVFTT